MQEDSLTMFYTIEGKTIGDVQVVIYSIKRKWMPKLLLWLGLLATKPLGGANMGKLVAHG